MMKKINFLQIIKEKKQKEERRHQAVLCSGGHCITKK